MPLKDYIQGNKHGKEANRLERAAMNDPFLQGALDGFENVAGDHVKIIKRLEKKFTGSPTASQKQRNRLLQWSQKQRNRLIHLSVAASILLLFLIGFGAYILLEKENRSSPMLAEAQPGIPTDSFASEAKQAIQENAEYNKVREPLPKPQAFKREMQSDKNLANSAPRSAEKRTFGEKEFQTWCRQRADKNICAGKGATVKVSFFIDETGKPSQIKYLKYSCEEAKKETDNLLSSSPGWTKTNRKVTLTIKW